ncbi:MAG: hypothetical protein IIV87_03355 [Oscillospiraceae bacterium]|nr:hypothetical protein [Oscillospiraceae bacterium]MBQ5749176.1 hypothetical protein [Oscillospiraceae bacterium]
MHHSITLIGGDARQYYIARSLLESGFDIACWQVPNMADTHRSLHDALCTATAVVLPMPALYGNHVIRSQKSDGIALESVFQSLPHDAVIFGGGLKAGADLFAQNPQKVFDYLDDEALTVRNAAATAEGALRIAMEQMTRTLWRSQVLVIGAGRIGKLLALRLKALGADVTVSARKASDFAWVEALGFEPERTGAYLCGLSQYACIFNTVPAPVLREEHLRAIEDDCPIIDLASIPYGLSPNLAAPKNYMQVPGIPGKDAPQTAGELLKTFIVQTLAEL